MFSRVRLARRWAAAARVSILLIVAFVYSSSAVAATITYTNRATFEATLGTKVTDDYSSAGYNPDNNVNTFDLLSNAAMSAVLGETDYTTTGFPNFNIVADQDTNARYCAGCNGSFLLGFTTTSVGTASGVFGAGFDIRLNSSTLPYTAFVTFGDATTANFTLPFQTFGAPPSFFSLDYLPN